MINSEIAELINRRRRQILVHSFLYYQLNENIISDHTFDKWSKELADLQKQYPEESKAGVYADEFKTFDGSSGYDLPYHYPEVQESGYKILKYHRRATK